MLTNHVHKALTNFEKKLTEFPQKNGYVTKKQKTKMARMASLPLTGNLSAIKVN